MEYLERAVETFKKPLSHILITHWHWDHLGGYPNIQEVFEEARRNPELAKLFPSSASAAGSFGIEMPKMYCFTECHILFKSNRAVYFYELTT